MLKPFTLYLSLPISDLSPLSKNLTLSYNNYYCGKENLQQQCLHGRSIPIYSTDYCRRDSFEDSALACIVCQFPDVKIAKYEANAGPASPLTSRSTAIGLLSPTHCLSRIGTMK